MPKLKTEKIILDGYGSYLGMEKGCFIVKDKEGKVEKYPLSEKQIGEVVLKSGNLVSVGALASLGFWETDCLILTRMGRPIAVVRTLKDYSHVMTRVFQLNSIRNWKATEIVKQIVYAKAKGQNLILEKHDLKSHDLTAINKRINSKSYAKNLTSLRRKLLALEGKYTKHYFKQILQLFPLKAESRKTFKAYDGLNNIFNLAYTFLGWKVYIAILKAKLEPYLGFLHSEQFGKPSLVLDLMELYRHLVDDFLIQFCENLKKKDFVMKYEEFSKDRKGKREYLNDSMTKELIRGFYGYLETKVEVPRVKYGFKQTLETLINEEALLLARYIRSEKPRWIPRVAYAM